VKYEITDAHAIALRGEYFDDAQGSRTGIAQDMKEVTLTWETKLLGSLILRPEYRHDWSNKTSFDSASGFGFVSPTNKGTKKEQDTLAFGVMYTW